MTTVAKVQNRTTHLRLPTLVFFAHDGAADEQRQYSSASQAGSEVPKGSERDGDVQNRLSDHKNEERSLRLNVGQSNQEHKLPVGI